MISRALIPLMIVLLAPALGRAGEGDDEVVPSLEVSGAGATQEGPDGAFPEEEIPSGYPVTQGGEESLGSSTKVGQDGPTRVPAEGLQAPPMVDEVELFLNRQRRRDLLLHRVGFWGSVALSIVGLGWGTYELVQMVQYRQEAADLRLQHNDYINSATYLDSGSVAYLREKAEEADQAAQGATERAGVGMALGAAAMTAAIILLILEPKVPHREVMEEGQVRCRPRSRVDGGGEIQLGISF